jgi:hypothetical protein
MINKPDDRQDIPERARRYVRGIVVAVSLTMIAFLFLYVTSYGDSHTDALAQPGAASAGAAAAGQVNETGSIIGTSGQRP